jgi:hypothetical protein
MGCVTKKEKFRHKDIVTTNSKLLNIIQLQHLLSFNLD